MADNTQVNVGSGDFIRDIDHSGVKSQVVGLDVNIGGAESLMTKTNGMPLADAYLANAGGPTATANTVLFTVDTTGFPSICVQLSGVWAGGVSFQTCNDNTTNWWPLIGLPINDDVSEVDTLLSNGMIALPCVGRYVRAITAADFQGTGGGVSWSAYFRNQHTLVDPSIAITTDPSVVLPVGGQDQNGAMHLLRTDTFGSLQQPDMLPVPIVVATTSQASAAGFTPAAMVFGPTDTTGYGSVVMVSDSLFSGATINIDGSHDGINWGLMPGVTISAAGIPAAASSATVSSANSVCVVPCLARYMRGRVATLGTARGVRVFLRRGDALGALLGTLASNITQVNGSAIPTGNGVAAGSIRVSLPTDGSGIVLTRGGTAAGSAIANAPNTAGGQARTTNPTAVADAQVVNWTFDKLGKGVVVGSIRDLKADQFTTLTSSVAETTIVTQVASTFNDLYGLIVVNDSATACEIEFRDTTGGSVRFTIEVPAGDTRGFMLNESAALKQTTVNTNWTAKCLTSVASIKITAMTVKNT